MNTTEVSGQSAPDTKGLQQVMRKHPLIFFFFLAYAFSWIVSLPYVLSVWGVLSGDYTIGFMLKQWVGPALAGTIMIRIVEGKPGQLSLRHRVRQWRAGWRWYLFTFLGVPALILIGIIVQPGALANFHGFTPGLLASYPAYFVAVFIGVGLPEEIGWRGFALPRLQQRYGPMGSTILLGVLWALWHLLFFFTPDHGGGPGASSSAFFLNFSVFFVMVVAVSFMFTWVFNNTKGSIFVVSLVHTAMDTSQLTWVPLFLNVGQSNSTAGETGLNLAALITFGVLALLIVMLTRGRLGYRPAGEGPLLGVGASEKQRTF